MSIEAHEVHIKNLYDKIEELSVDCESQHRVGLEAIREIHRRIDDFTKIMMQLSEINKDVQSLVAHQKTLEAEAKALNTRVNTVEAATNMNTETSNGLKKIAWAIVLGFGGLLGGTLWQIVLSHPK